MNRHKRRYQNKVSRSKPKLRWVSNDVAVPTLENIIPRDNETREQALRSHIKWRRQFVVGDPASTKELSVQELVDAGIVGLYAKDLTKFF